MTNSETPKNIKDLSKTEKSAIILEALMKEGYNQNQAAHLMKVSRAYTNQLNKNIKQGTLNPLVAKARKSVKAILEGKKVGDMGEVRGSDVLTAAKMVLDRADPVTQKIQNTNVSVSYELPAPDVDRYKKALGIIDAEFVVLPDKPLPQITDGKSNEQTTD
jgi:predicted DNA-binding protein (UPF0251 family)